eukprot:UN02347
MYAESSIAHSEKSHLEYIGNSEEVDEYDKPMSVSSSRYIRRTPTKYDDKPCKRKKSQPKMYTHPIQRKSNRASNFSGTFANRNNRPQSYYHNDEIHSQRSGSIQTRSIHEDHDEKEDEVKEDSGSYIDDEKVDEVSYLDEHDDVRSTYTAVQKCTYNV